MVGVVEWFFCGFYGFYYFFECVDVCYCYVLGGVDIWYWSVDWFIGSGGGFVYVEF